MIETIITHACPRCGSVNLVKNGYDYKGAQKFRCNDCHRYGTLVPQTPYEGYVRQSIKQAVTERLSLRGIERVFGVSRCTVNRWLDRWMAHVLPLEATLVEAQPDDVLELDE